MVDDSHNQPYHTSPGTTWGRSPQFYPHSHHGTPAQEFSSFHFGSPSIPMNAGTFEASMPQRPVHQQLQPLVMPQWPSMLNSQSQPTFQHTYPQPVQPIQPMALAPLPTPVSATSSRSASTPRKTLTDSDRKAMCLYAEENPTAKQTEIGSRFGVERSTVSKVLRQKEKYLSHDDGSRSPAKRLKGRSPDIERALANWAKNQEKKGVPLSDELIRHQARAFSATSSNPESASTLSSSWLEKFKFKNNLMGARSRKGSAIEDTDDTSLTASTSHTPNNVSPSSDRESNSPEEELDGAPGPESSKLESPDAYSDFKGSQLHSESHNSLNSAFTDAPNSFSPAALSPASPFFTPESATSASPFIGQFGRLSVPTCSDANVHAHRVRSQTFPLLDQYMSDVGGTSIEHPAPKYMLHTQVEDMSEPLPHLNSAIDGMHAENRPHTITPSDMMRPPPLPSNMTAPRSLTPASSANLSATSPEEAQKAMEVVLSFFEQQPNGFLDMQESITVGKLMEKLRLQTRTG